MSFTNLPAELYESIFNHVPSSDLQQTVLSVTRAIPLSPVPISSLFRSIRIAYPVQAIHLYRRLRVKKTDTGLSGNETAWVKEFSIESWSVDADVILNLVRLLPKLQTLNIWIGPENFTPEHLEELFLKPSFELKHLSLRFRPYVQRATYYQFLRGAYFDSTLLAISRWPTATLSTLSIIQDPVVIDPRTGQRQSFAQPLVFFRIDPCLSILIHSTALFRSLTSLCIRLPARPVVRSLCTPAAYSSSGNLPISLMPPNLVSLDLSTSGVLENELDMLLVYFASLQHIILDGCGVLRGDLHNGECHALGKRCALVGVRRAKERGKALKTWLESRDIRDTSDDNYGSTVGARPNGLPRKAKGGRKGLATSTISFRTPSTNSATSSPTLSLARDTAAEPSKGIPKIRILASPPCLLSLSVTVPPTIKKDKYPIIRAEFEAGWAEGIAQLAVTRARMRGSAGNGVRVMGLVSKDGNEDDSELDEEEEFREGLKGLVDIEPDDDDAFGMCGELQAPVLCFAGPYRDGHPTMTSTTRSAIASLKSFGGSIVDSYRGPRPPPVVFPPPSWEIDDETYESKKPKSPPEPVPTEPSISFARRIGTLIDSLPALPSAVTTSPPSTQDEGKQGSPVPVEMDKYLVRMLASEEIMNGRTANDTNSNNSNRKNTQHHNIWNILAGLKSTTGSKDPEDPPPNVVEEHGVMMYAPLEPNNDSQLEFANSETVLEYVDDPVPAASTSTINYPESDGKKIEGTTSASTSKPSPTPPTLTPTQKGKQTREKHIWVPSTTKVSVLATWWGYRLYLPPPVMAILNGTSLKATARAAMLTTALKWLLDKIPLMLVPVQFRPAIKMLKTLSPVVGYIGVFIAWSWDRVKSLDKGHGVVLTATWLLPVALLPMSWDAGDIYGPRLASQQERDAPPSDDNVAEAKKASKSNDDKEKQKQATKKTIFAW